jgi:hypothetical protein
MRGKIGRLQKLLGDRRGAIGILAAFVMVGVVGVSALALEYGHGLLQKTENQRVADLAAYGGALVYNATSSSSSATSAVNNIVALNGLSGDGTTSIANSPTGDGNQAVQVTVTSNVPLLLARVLTTKTTMAVSATAYAEVKTSAPGCVIALNGSGSGVSLSGGTQITTNNCAVASNNAVTLTGGTKITTKNIDYGTSYSTGGGGNIVPPAGTASVTYAQVTTADPLSGNSAVSAATAHIGFNASGTCAGTAGTVCAITSPSGPSVSAGSNITFNSNSKSGSLPASCSTSSTRSPWTVTCTGTGPFNFNTITIGGGSAVTFNNASSGATYTFSGVVNATSSNGLTFNGGSGATYSMAAGVVTGGNAPISFTAGTFNIGKGTGSCNSSSGYSICDNSTLTIGGPSTFVLSGGIYVGGGSTLNIGSGSTNSYDIGAANDGFSIDIGGGASTTLADATGSGDLFETAGNIANGGSSSACLTVPAAAAHDINGYVSLACGATLGSGVYTIWGYVAIGGSGGGGSVTGNNVTLVIGAATVPSSGSCKGLAFCVASGFGNVTLTAPTAGTAEDLAVIGPPSSSSNPTAGALFTEGSSSTTISGAFYMPNGSVSLGGSGTINNGGGCLELVGSQVTLSGGSTATSTCSGLGSSTGGTVSLVQ